MDLCNVDVLVLLINMLNITLCNFLLNAHKNITFARFPFQLSSKVSGHTVKSKCFAILVIRL